MVDTTQSQSPTNPSGSVDITPSERTPAVEITLLRHRSIWRLKSWQTPRFAARADLTGQILPTNVGTTASGVWRILCLGPGEWLFTAPTTSTLSTPVVAIHPIALVDLTDGLTGFRLQGPLARELLSKGCGLDLHPRSLPPGRCARTRLAQIPVVIDCLDDSSGIDLYAARSYGACLKSWLTDAAAEWA
jgi:heterotetrameric sarcosine oxidase gamma subunit